MHQRTFPCANAVHPRVNYLGLKTILLHLEKEKNLQDVEKTSRLVAAINTDAYITPAL